MNKLILIAGGSTLVYAVLAMLMGVLPGIELSKTPPGPGVEPLTALQARRPRCLRRQRLQLLPYPAGAPAAAGQGVWPSVGARETSPTRRRSCWVPTYGSGSDQHGRASTERGMAVHPPVQPARGGTAVDHAGVRLVVPSSRSGAAGVTPVALPKAYAPTHGRRRPDARRAGADCLFAVAEATGIAGGAARHRPRASQRRRLRRRAGIRERRRGAGKCTTPPRVRHCSPPPAPPAIRPPVRVCPEHSLRSRATRWSTTPIRHSIFASYCTDCKAPTSAASSTPVRCRRSALHSVMPTSPNIINYERSSWGNHGAPVTAEQVAAERAKGN